MEHTRLVVVDSLRLVAAGIGELLRPRYGEVDVLVDGRSVLEAAAVHRPDLILTHLSIPEVDGLEITRRLSRASPEVPVMVLADRSDPTAARMAFEAGARGFLAKTAPTSELYRAVDEVLHGGRYMNPLIAGDLMASMLSPETPRGLVTPREQEIAGLVAQGLETAEIACRLYIAEVTVRTHLRRILKKLGLRNRVELTRHVLAERVAEERRPALLVS